MNWKRALLTVVVLGLAIGTAYADSPFFKQFKSDYGTLDQDLLNNEGETGPVKDFVYQKDVATLTLKEGTVFFLRYVNNRPTTAIFIGKGNMKIDIPSHVERQALWFASHDSTVNEDFEVCFIRMADDLDQQIKAKFPMEKKQLGWKDFTIAKQAQGEFHFKPAIQDRYDSYFELLRSLYERSADGYFFIDFNRYTFTFDPNIPEQTIVGYEHESGDQGITNGAVMQRKERNIYDDSKMSEIVFPTTILSRDALLDLTGNEGTAINKAQTDMQVLVNADSLRFMSLFIHYHLAIDSMTVNGKHTDYMRRSDFNFVGVILPQYFHKGDTLAVRLWYHGSNYLSPMPYVDNPAPTAIKLTVTALPEFNYVMPGMGKIARQGGRQHFTVEPDQPFDQFEFRPYALGFDSSSVTTTTGIPLIILKSPDISKNKYDCYVADEQFRKVVTEGIDFIGARLGNPPGTFGLEVYPISDQSIAGFGGMATSQGSGKLVPGWAEVPQVHCLADGDGQLQVIAGPQLAKQWFGALMRPASEREGWLAGAVTEYLGLIYVQASLPGSPFYTELLRRKQDFEHVYFDRNNDRPLATGERVTDSLKVTKGAWVMHMLRELMQAIDQEKDKDRSFYRFLLELSSYVNNRSFTNADVQRIAEKYYGQKLDWFFNYWVYGRNIPNFNVTYNYVQEGNDWFVKGTIDAKGVDANFQMPVICRIEKQDGSSALTRQVVKGNSTTFQLGPYPGKPKSFSFNEYFSVLSNDNVNEGKK